MYNFCKARCCAQIIHYWSKKGKENGLNHKPQLLAVYKTKQQKRSAFNDNSLNSPTNFHKSLRDIIISIIIFLISPCNRWSRLHCKLQFYHTDLQAKVVAHRWMCRLKVLQKKSITRNEKSRHSCLRYFFEAKPNHKRCRSLFLSDNLSSFLRLVSFFYSFIFFPNTLLGSHSKICPIKMDVSKVPRHCQHSPHRNCLYGTPLMALKYGNVS